MIVNKCYFKNEKDKKPENFDTTNIKIVDLLLNDLMPGLYHPNCHCKEIPIDFLGLDDITLIVSHGKINYMFFDKGDWINAMGYHENDYELFVQTLLRKTKEAFFYGYYYIVNHTKYGCKINLSINIPGINEKNNKIYKIKTNYMVFPNGKLKMNTPIGGWQ